MLRRLHLALAALAFIVAPLLMQSGSAMAAMPSYDRAAAENHCDGSAPEDSDRTEPMAQCCVAMCSAIAPMPAVIVEPPGYTPVAQTRFVPSGLPSFLAKLPTPPPRRA